MDWLEDLSSFTLLLTLLGSGVVVTVAVLFAFVVAINYLEDIDG